MYVSFLENLMEMLSRRGNGIIFNGKMFDYCTQCCTHCEDLLSSCIDIRYVICSLKLWKPFECKLRVISPYDWNTDKTVTPVLLPEYLLRMALPIS